MAITRAQQAKQMLQNGGRIGLQVGGQSPGPRGQRGGSRTSPGSGSKTGGGGRDVSDDYGQFDRRQRQNKALKGTGFLGKDQGMNVGLQKNVLQRGIEAATKFSPVFNILNALSTNRTNLKPVDLSMAQRDGRDDILPLWAQLGFNSEEEFQAAQRMSQAPSNMDQETEDPQGLEGLRLAFRADGGPIGGEYDFESARQMYGLGKLVKKVTRTVKKIAKSPIGKAALIGGGLGLAGIGPFKGLASTPFGSSLSNFFGKGSFNPLKAISAVTGQAGPRIMTNISPFGKLIGAIPGGGVTAAIAGTSLLAGLLTPEQEEEAQLLATEQGIDIEAARNSILARAQGNIQDDFRARGFRAEGGRIGYDEAGAVMSKGEMEKLAKSPLYKGFKKMYNVDPSMAKGNESYKDKFSMFEQLLKKGYQKGGDVEPVAKKTMPLLDMDGKEMDLREEGGFVPIGRMEKADDVPARLSKNEFVFTADAVRNAGDGDVDKGAEVMYNMMKNLEAGGDVSEESQGKEGARRMFQTSQRLEEVL
jgi:hypothetical protein